MARVVPLAPRPPARIDPIPVAWGALVASVGLMAGGGRDMPVRLAAVVLSFGLAGFLAGVRAISRRPRHALVAGVAAYAVHACFIAVTFVIDALGGPGSPPLVPGTGGEWATVAITALASALAGGLLANAWLSPAGRDGR